MTKLCTYVLIPSMKTDPGTILSPEWARFFCGGVAGTVSRTMTAPLDRIKVLRQTGASEIRSKSLIQCCRVLVNEGGWTALWRGNGVNVLKNCPESAIRFGLHGWLKSVLFPNVDGTLSLQQRIFVAGLSGFVSLTATYPIEVVKTRMALRKSTDPASIANCARVIYRNVGVRGFYRGYKISMLSYVPYSSMELALYETLKRRYLTHRGQQTLQQSRESAQGRRHHNQSASSDNNHLPVHVSIPLVVFSCCLPIMIVYPANLLRTRYQAANTASIEPILSSLLGIWRTEGPRGWYQGMAASLSKSLPSVCITYLVYEFTSELMHVPGLGAK